MLIVHAVNVRRFLRVAVSIVLLSTAMVLVGQQHAQAEVCDPPAKWIDGELVYGWCEDGETEDPGDEDGDSEPSCDLNQAPPDSGADEWAWCEGEYACHAFEAYADPEGEPPSKDAVWIFKTCYGPDGKQAYQEYQWYEADEPSLEELAWEAYGNLQLPNYSLEFNPPETTYVTLATWWWADGPGNGEITGTSAGPVVAIATPDRVDVDPGDGSDPVECGWVTSKSDDCRYTYKKASVSGGTTASDGSPAYPARSRLVYEVRFENNGTVMDLPGLPTTIETDWQGTPVPVAEIQGFVTR